MFRINESSRQMFTASFQDETRALFTPTSIRYRLDDLKTKTNLIAWTTVMPATTVDITIPATANGIISNRNRHETKVLTVQSDYGTANQLSQDIAYEVRNMSGFES